MNTETAELVMRYTNWRGETSIRTVRPERIWHGATQWHGEGWFLTAWDVDKGARRHFALDDCEFDRDLWPKT